MINMCQGTKPTKNVHVTCQILRPILWYTQKILSSVHIYIGNIVLFQFTVYMYTWMHTPQKSASGDYK
jgi:hypothetical protein